MEDVRKEPLLFLEALALFQKREFKLPNEIESLKNESFLTIVKTKMHIFSQIVISLKLSFIILEQQGRHVLLRYNSKCSKNIQTGDTVLIWMFHSDGYLLKTFQNIQDCPPLSHYNFRFFNEPEPLWQILNLDKPEPDPQTFNETCQFLHRHNKLNQLYLIYYFKNSRKSLTEFWTLPNQYNCVVHIFTTNNYTLGFQKSKNNTQAKLNSVQISDLKNVTIPVENKANKSCAVSVKLSFLNLAFSLACCTSEELKEWSLKLSRCAVFLWMEYDETFKSRFLTIYSRSQFFQVEINQDSDWQVVFNRLFSERLALKEVKKKILTPLLQRLETKNLEINTLYKKCHTQIKSILLRLKIIVFSHDDTALHALKIPLATYLVKRDGHKFKHLQLNLGAKNNNLSMLQTSELVIFNLNQYLQEDENVKFENSLPQPPIKSSVKKLKHCPLTNNLTTIQLCKLRGEQFSVYFFTKWTNVICFFLEHFQFDIAVGPLLSLSCLSFQIIWTKYSKLAGIFHQGLEKTKSSYETLFRTYSHGGYSFSCGKQVECFKSLNECEPLSTILELDITSSYGFAGSFIQSPKGFCNAFVNEGDNILKCIEPVARHQSFEFLSVYYTIWLLQQQGLEIQTIYSNFHQNGLFSINKYIIDLTVITTNGQLYLFQFDGSFVHGCRKGCSSLKSYVNGQSRTLLEAKTQKRDDSILEWVNASNAIHFNSVFYFVISNCHDKHYSLKALRKKFNSESVLQNVIEGYPLKKTLTQDEIIFCGSNMTFLILLEGYVPLKQSLLLHENNQWHRSFTCTQKPTLFSKDYLDWLIQCCNFQITTIHKVFLYKRCTILNQIYKELIEFRLNKNTSPSVKKLLKNLINYSVGFFGLNQNKPKYCQVKLVSKLTRRFNHCSENVINLNENVEFFIKSKIKTRTAISAFSMSSTPIPIFVMIIEFGKMRMSQILCFFDAFLQPAKYKHLYSHVDNFVLALSTNTLEEAVFPQKQLSFVKESNKYFLLNTPGHLKLEWIIFKEQEWKFISPHCMAYALITNDSLKNIAKISSLNNISPQESFQYGLNMLDKKPFSISQIRRVDKKLNKDVKITVFEYNKSKL